MDFGTRLLLMFLHASAWHDGNAGFVDETDRSV